MDCPDIMSYNIDLGSGLSDIISYNLDLGGLTHHLALSLSVGGRKPLFDIRNNALKKPKVKHIG